MRGRITRARAARRRRRDRRRARLPEPAGQAELSVAAEPYTDVATHVRDELRRVVAAPRVSDPPRLAQETGAASATTSSGPTDMGRLFAPARGAAAAGADDAGAEQVLEQWLAAHEQIEARIRATIEARVRSPLVDLIRTFELTQRQWSTLDVRAAARDRSEPRAGLSLPRARPELPRARRPPARAARLRHAADALADGARSVAELAAAALPAARLSRRRSRATR